MTGSEVSTVHAVEITHLLMCSLDEHAQKRCRILEIHFVDRRSQADDFSEELLTI